MYQKEDVSVFGHILFFFDPYNYHTMNRIVGCQSTNHIDCKGELWECERCHKIICWEEGSTDLIDLCDNCWYEVRVLGHASHLEITQ